LIEYIYSINILLISHSNLIKLFISKTALLHENRRINTPTIHSWYLLQKPSHTLRTKPLLGLWMSAGLRMWNLFIKDSYIEINSMSFMRGRDGVSNTASGSNQAMKW